MFVVPQKLHFKMLGKFISYAKNIFYNRYNLKYYSFDFYLALLDTHLYEYNYISVRDILYG